MNGKGRREAARPVPAREPGSSLAVPDDLAQTGGAVFIVPAPTDSCPDWARWALGIRAGATVVGECPACGAERTTTPDPFDSPQLIGGIAHQPGCPAVDPRLEQLGEADVELRVIVVTAELMQEIAA